MNSDSSKRLHDAINAFAIEAEELAMERISNLRPGEFGYHSVRRIVMGTESAIRKLQLAGKILHAMHDEPEGNEPRSKYAV